MNIVKDAFIKSLPILVGYVILGFGFGILLADAGYGVAWALAMSLFIYAGSMQYVGVSLITAPASLLTTAITTLVINARHLFYGLSMIKKYQNTGKFKPYLIFSLTDETYAVISGSQEEKPYAFYFFLSFFNHCYWVIGTVFGSFASALPFNTEGISFSMTALFVAAYTDQLLKKTNIIPSVVGLLVTLIMRFLFGKDLFLIPSMIVITLVLLLLPKKPKFQQGYGGQHQGQNFQPNKRQHRQKETKDE